MGSVLLTSPEGDTVSVPTEQAQTLIDRHGYHPPVNADLAARAGAAQREADSSAIGALGQGIARTVTAGGSDALQTLVGGEDERIRLAQQKESHPYGALAGEVGGAFLPTGAASIFGKAGRAVGALGEGGGLLRAVGGAVAGGATEGALYGAGNAVSQLALSDDPIDVEHITGALSSNMLLGGAIGGVAGGAFKLGEKALSRASSTITKAGEARAAMQSIPEDLAGLDAKGLDAARAAAKTEHTAEIAAERKNLDSLRVEQRAELANQIKDFHTELSTERPIFQAITGDDVRAIPGIGDAASQLNKSYRGLRGALDNRIAVAENPERLLGHLQMQQTALEGIQAKAPELQAVLAGDARAAALEHVDLALEQNKAFQAQIRQLSSKTPLQSGRLTMLEAAESPRMIAIDAAKEALKNAPELGMIGKAAKTAAFGGGTALAHMIPGVGIAAPFLGKAASDAVGKLFEHLAGHVSGGIAKSDGALQSFLGKAAKIGEAATPVAATTATKILSSVRFGTGPEAKSTHLPDLYQARSLELRQQTEYGPDGTLQMRPDARLAMSQKLAPIATVNPILADRIETAAARKTVYMSSKLPKRPEVGGMQIGPDKYKPSDLEIRSFARTVRACEDPHGVELRLAQGNLTPEDAEAYRVCYPERYAQLQQAIATAAPQLSKTLPTHKKVALFVFTGVPTMPALTPNVLAVLQGNFASEPGSKGGTSAPKPMPAFGAMGSIKSVDKPTPAQAREGT